MTREAMGLIPVYRLHFLLSLLQFVAAARNVKTKLSPQFVVHRPVYPAPIHTAPAYPAPPLPTELDPVAHAMSGVGRGAY